MKRTKFFKMLTVVMALAMCATMGMACNCSSKTNYAANNTTLKIGVSGPLTGGAAVYGVAVQDSAQMAVAEVNADIEKNKTLDYKFEVTILDDVHNAKNAETNYAALYEKGMQVSLACVTSTPCLSYAKLAQEDGVFCITPSASSDAVPVIGNNIFQMCFSDSNQGKATANLFKDSTSAYYGKKVGILYNSSDAYSIGIKDTFVANQGDINVVETQSFTEGATDFTTQAQKLKGCEIIFMPIYYTPAAAFIKEAVTNQDYAADVVFFGCDGFDGIDRFDTVNFNVNNYTQPISYLTHFSAQDESATTYVTNFKASYDAMYLNQFGASAYDCVWAIYKAIVSAKTAGKSIPVTIAPWDLSTILQDVFTSSTFNFTGVTGKGKVMSWDKSGTVNKTASVVVVNEKDA